MDADFLTVNGETRPYVINLDEDEDWMDRGERIEQKLDEAVALLHRQIGASEAQAKEIAEMKAAHAKEIAEMKADHAAVTTEIKAEHNRLEAQVQELRDAVAQARGSAVAFKWLASMGGVAGAGSAAVAAMKMVGG